MIRRLVLAALLLAAPAWAQSTNFQPGANPVSNQGYSLFVVSPDDTAKFAVTRALWIGAAAACSITVLANGDTTAVQFTDVQSGQFLPLQIVQVKSTGTTCTGIVGIR